MSSEIPFGEFAVASGKDPIGQIDNITQMLHAEVDEANKESSGGSMDFIRNHRKIKFSSDSRLSLGVSLLLELITFLSIVLYRWAHIQFLKKSDTYFVCIWMENIVSISLLHCLFRTFRLSKCNLLKNLKLLLPLVTLNVAMVTCHGYNFISFTRKSGGSEFYQLSLVLYIPILLAIIHVFCTYELPRYTSNIIALFMVLKIIILFDDPEFSLSLWMCCGSVVYAFICSCYLVCLKADLQKFTILQLIYSLSLIVSIALPIFIIEQEELKKSFRVVYIVIAVLTGMLKTVSCYLTFLLVKHTDPLRCLVIMNAAYVPDHFIQALIYKLDCSISSCKICFFIIIELVVGHFKGMERAQHIDDRLRYSLMK